MEFKCKRSAGVCAERPANGRGDDGHHEQPSASGRRSLVTSQTGKSQTDLEWPRIAQDLPQMTTKDRPITTPTSSAALNRSMARNAGLCQDDASMQKRADGSYSSYLESGVNFIKLVFSRPPLTLNRRATRFSQAEARVLGKMAKVWYIKKKIKKLSKKLKKHTIAVPVFTAIPIYEHSYYPQPHVTHVSHHGGMHHAAASSYAPATVAQVAAASNSATSATVPAHQHQQMATSASNQHQVAAYRMAPHHRSLTGSGGGPAAASLYHTPMAAAHHIINAYAPSPPLYVDDTGGLYGHYGNAYGRYDGGYHVW